MMCGFNVFEEMPNLLSLLQVHIEISLSVLLDALSVEPLVIPGMVFQGFLERRSLELGKRKGPLTKEMFSKSQVVAVGTSR